MLSILIPVFNYNVVPLVTGLHKQCMACGIVFEIVALDDGSDTLFKTANAAINTLQYCSYIEADRNMGRSAARNRLAKMATYNALLFLDADVMPAGDGFIKGYLKYIPSLQGVVYGGILYAEQKPEEKQILRWAYGREREALPQEKRQLNTYKSLLTLNFLISKEVFESVSFNEAIPNLRHEDTLYSYELSINKVPVQHIANEVYHLGLESSEIFIHKSEQSAEGLLYLLENNLLPCSYISMAKAYCFLKKYRLCSLATILYRVTKTAVINNLKSGSPSLLLFDLYRLGYICSLKINNV